MTRSLIYGVGVNDYPDTVFINRKDKPFYKVWRSMIVRCYSAKYHKQRPTYIGCKICEDWRSVTTFKKWFDKHYISGWQLDKDILNKGNKIYSPDACVFIPIEINSFYTSNKSNHCKELPIGVDWREKEHKFRARIRLNNRDTHLGLYNTPEEAFNAYKVAKEAQARILAERYKDQLEPRAYKALLNFSVNYSE